MDVIKFTIEGEIDLFLIYGLRNEDNANFDIISKYVTDTVTGLNLN